MGRVRLLLPAHGSSNCWFGSVSEIDASVCSSALASAVRRSTTARVSCYSVGVPKNVTLKLSEEVAHWARKQAAEENTSVSRLVSRMLEEKMRQNDSYWRAYQEWKSDQPLSKTSAANRLSREEVHERK